MSVESIRKFCLSFPQAKENLQWGDDLCFKVRGKIFALLDLNAVPPRVMFKCEAEKFFELIEHEDIIPAPYVGRYKWVSVEKLTALPWRELKDLIEHSYQMVVAKEGINKRPRLKNGKATVRASNSKKTRPLTTSR
jgi:predicted DNA-binding protein (MmcQ/YjbR family)